MVIMEHCSKSEQYDHVCHCTFQCGNHTMYSKCTQSAESANVHSA